MSTIEKNLPTSGQNTVQSKHSLKINTMTLVAVMAAVMCVLGPLTIPIGTVPVSLTVFTVWLGVTILGKQKGTLSYLIYLLIGLVGVPVFSGFTAGPGKLFGPTGGYLLGFIPMAWISGVFIEKFHKKIYLQMLGMLIGLLFCYIPGTIMLSVMMDMKFLAALSVGVFPFILFDLIKMVLALVIGQIIRSRIRHLL
jgi:biotin transport system substrate-specific component